MGNLKILNKMTLDCKTYCVSPRLFYSSGAVSWLPSNARGVRGHAPPEEICEK